MVSKSQLQLIRSLQQKKFRELHQLFLVEGPKMVNELLMSRIPVSKIFADPDWLKINRKNIPDGVETVTVSENELSRISNLKTPNQVLALAKTIQPQPLSHNKFEDIVVMLDGINDPGNLGTILRISDWFGIKTIICSENTVDIYNPKTIQASMGSLFRVEVHYRNLPEVISEFVNECDVFGTFLEGKNIYREHLPENGIIVIGSESHGISPEVAALIKTRLYIPSFSQGAESLNASIATAIVCSEFRRRKKQVV